MAKYEDDDEGGEVKTKAKVWLAEPEVMETVYDLIHKHFPELAMLEGKVQVLFKEKGKAKVSKSSPLMKSDLLGKEDYTFLITIGDDYWDCLESNQKIAFLFHLLCQCGVEETDAGEKLSVLEPEMYFFRKEVEKFGFWRTGETAVEPGLVDQIFG